MLPSLVWFNRPNQQTSNNSIFTEITAMRQLAEHGGSCQFCVEGTRWFVTKHILVRNSWGFWYLRGQQSSKRGCGTRDTGEKAALASGLAPLQLCPVHAGGLGVLIDRQAAKHSSPSLSVRFHTFPQDGRWGSGTHTDTHTQTKAKTEHSSSVWGRRGWGPMEGSHAVRPWASAGSQLRWVGARTGLWAPARGRAERQPLAPQHHRAPWEPHLLGVL